MEPLSLSPPNSFARESWIRCWFLEYISRMAMIWQPHRLASYPLSVVRARLRGGKHTAGRSVSQSASQPASPTDTQPRCMDNRTRPVHTAARGKDDESVLGHLYALTVDRTLPVTRPAHRGGSRPEALDRGFPFPVKDTTYPDYSLLRSEGRMDG